MGQYSTETKPDTWTDAPPPPQTAWDDPNQYGPRIDDGGADASSAPTGTVNAGALDAAHGHYTEVGPSAHAYSNDDETNVGFSAVDNDANGVHVQMLETNGKVNKKDGVVVDGGVLKVDIPPGGALGPLGVDGGILDASVQDTVTDDEFAIGAGANLVDGAATVGSKQNNARFGMSYGLGAAARLHYAKDPNTYKRSYGFGFDAGPISADVRTDVFSSPELNPTEDAKMDSTADDDDPRFNAPITGYAEPEKAH